MNVEVYSALLLLNFVCVMVMLKRGRLIADRRLIVIVFLRFGATVLASDAESIGRVRVTRWRLLMIRLHISRHLCNGRLQVDVIVHVINRHVAWSVKLGQHVEALLELGRGLATADRAGCAHADCLSTRSLTMVTRLLVLVD